MKLRLLLFAGLAERLGGSEIELELDDGPWTAGRLKDVLIDQFPAAEDGLRSAFIAVNQAYAEETTPIRETDEVAVIPPVSGGEPELASITREPIDANEVAAKVSHPNHGAAIVFIGTTREYTHGQRTTLLEYEAYEPMALRTMNQIIDEIRECWNGALCALTHRLGTVGIGEASVVIAVSAPHRDAAYEASRYAIDRLKQIVPIWKKEVWEDGSEWKGHQTGPWNPVSPLQEGDAT